MPSRKTSCPCSADKRARVGSCRVQRRTLGLPRGSIGWRVAAPGGPCPVGREAMEQMRHTDVRLTTKIYTDPRLIDMYGAVNRIPRISLEPEKRESQRATGTDGAIGPVRSPSTKPARSDIRSDIRKEVSGRGQNWPQMAISPSAEAPNGTPVTHSKQSSYDAAKNRRGGDSNPRYSVNRTLVFETSSFSRSDTSPKGSRSNDHPISELPLLRER